MTKPLQVGITGGIGSGKSLVCKIFNTLGAPVYYADDRAKWLANHNQPIRQQVIKAFGAEAYDEHGLNRAYLANTVFNDQLQLARLNAIIHPAVGSDYRTWVGEQHAPYVLKEAALMFESGSYKALDRVVTVSAPEDMRIERVLQRDTFRSRDQIKAIIDKQLSEQERCERSDHIIKNDGSELVILQVLELHERFIHAKD